MDADYIEVNRKLWDEKTKVHAVSAFYNRNDGSFLRDIASLNEIELQLLGDVSGRRILHLQCHFGQDTLSLARLGAEVTGVDFSGEAIAAARKLNEQLSLSAAFICANIYELPDGLDGRHDIIFTSYGVIGWLPDMQSWARVIARCLKPGGRLVFVEFHPVVWMFGASFSSIDYSYFNREAIIETSHGTYADREAPIAMTEIGWNHNLAEVMQSLLDAGLTISRFAEYDYAPYPCFQPVTEVAKGRYQVKGFEGKLPMVYALIAEKAA